MPLYFATSVLNTQHFKRLNTLLNSTMKHSFEEPFATVWLSLLSLLQVGTHTHPPSCFPRSPSAGCPLPVCCRKIHCVSQSCSLCELHSSPEGHCLLITAHSHFALWHNKPSLSHISHNLANLIGQQCGSDWIWQQAVCLNRSQGSRRNANAR